jgi:hypothetical protein
VGYFDEADSSLHQPSCQQAALAKLPAVLGAKIRAFLFEFEYPVEVGAAQTEALRDRRVIVREARVNRFGVVLLQSR